MSIIMFPTELLRILAASNLRSFVLDSSLIKRTLFAEGKKRPLLPLGQARMQQAIERHGLILKRGTGGDVFLENTHCRLIFCGLYEDRVLL